MKLRELEVGMKVVYCYFPHPGKPDYAQEVYPAVVQELRARRPHRPYDRPEWVKIEASMPWGSSEEWVRARDLLGEWSSWEPYARAEQRRHRRAAEQRDARVRLQIQECLDYLGDALDADQVHEEGDDLDYSLLTDAQVHLPLDVLHRLVESAKRAPGATSGVGALDSLLHR